MNVALLDLKNQYRSIEKEINTAIKRVLESGAFILGTEVASLEQEVADYLGVKYAVGVASGTDALMLSLLACGVQKGDEVITAAFTFIATVEAIIHSGATPVFVDINPDTYNMDTAKIEDKISSRTKAIMPVHMYGQSADMDEILQIAKRHNLCIIEDAAQAFGAEYKNKKAGTWSNAGCFSFFPSKNFAAYGDGGMVVTDDEHTAKQVRMLRVHGSNQKYIHNIIGYNSRLDELQAAVLRVKLQYIDNWNKARRKRASMYNELLRGIDAITPVEKKYNRHIYHQYTVRMKHREECKNYLAKNGIATAIHYPLCVFEQECYRYLNYTKKDLPVSFTASKEVLSLPMYPELPENKISYICNNIKEL